MPTYAELKRENAAQKERLEYWRGQVKQTTRKTVRVADVDKAAQAVLNGYQSKADFGQVRNAMVELANGMIGPKADPFLMDSVTSEDGMESALWQRAREQAVDIAYKVVEQAQAQINESEMETFRDIKAYLRANPIALKNNKADIPDFGDFRKRNFGRFTLSEKGTAMDVLWLHLQNQFGKGFFPEEITNPADQLLHLEDLYNAMEPQYVHAFCCFADGMRFREIRKNC